MGKLKEFFQFHKIAIVLILSAIAFYASFAYDLHREDLLKLFSLYLALFFVSWKLVQVGKGNFKLLLLLAIGFRLIFLVAIPNLSQDFYRFIWDGRLILEGWNPYLYTPQHLMESGNFPVLQAQELLAGMGNLSAEHFTNYPPLNQLLFAMTSFFGGKSILGTVVGLRIIIILADIGILFIGRKLLKKLNLPEHYIWFYILNPFVIIEITGNLHFESVMLFLLLLSTYFLHTNKWIWSAVFMALSISLKLLPLLFLPLLFHYFEKDKAERGLYIPRLIGYYFIVASLVILSFLPFLSRELIFNFGESLGLWFQKFEFNASIYYLVRWIGFQEKGYNIIEAAGKCMAFLVVLIVIGIAYFRRNNSTRNLIVSMLLAVFVYLLLATTVHPWYVATPLLLSIFTRYKFVQIWSVLIIVSYAAYANKPFEENTFLLFLEYVPVIGYFFYETFILKKAKEELFPLAIDEKKVTDVNDCAEEMR